jgi:hypothetical protein
VRIIEECEKRVYPETVRKPCPLHPLLGNLGPSKEAAAITIETLGGMSNDAKEGR